ncbi:hypothetical protein KZZ52_49035 [Dactylosporangium sp. AC04546]|uniref:hypothetical protein n=1 Tax=Dactylosporangium sp. AC04546 TaxID=2862460 RepID=UPI002E7BF1EA|nr:hypothetical protein [Dactylosporangium sp. AC04546]WVK81834.1 hypothetical protein KZZ52_49035 [Dactylosporangium sp. AC04546]
MDVQSLAVSLDADPVRAIRADPELWASASEQPPFCAAWGDEPLPDISQALLTAVPAGAGWVRHFEDRSFQQAEYLLDPMAYRAARTWEERERTVAYRIIAGDQAFAEHATSGQGFAWRCSTTAFLATAVERIDALDVAAVRAEFSVVEMDRLGLYKVDREEDDEHAFARVLTQLRAFAEHCRAVVTRDLDLIITLY